MLLPASQLRINKLGRYVVQIKSVVLSSDRIQLLVESFKAVESLKSAMSIAINAYACTCWSFSCYQRCSMPYGFHCGLFMACANLLTSQTFHC